MGAKFITPKTSKIDTGIKSIFKALTGWGEPAADSLMGMHKKKKSGPGSKSVKSK